MEVSDDIKNEFLLWYQDLHLLSQVRINRWFQYCFSSDNKISIHTFCDASQHAYAAAVFIRIQKFDEVQVELLAAKSRVTPVKPITIPRLELIAATVGARLCHSVMDGLQWKDDVELHFWTDSTTTLSWIQRDEVWTVFVNNRVQEIRKLTNTESWKHVPGNLNPADLPSRGCTAKQLVASRWWEGPEWLKETPKRWPSSKTVCNEETICKEKRKINSHQVENLVKCMINQSVNSCESCGFSNQDKNDLCKYHGSKWYFRYFSSYDKMIRMVAWMRRFVHNCQSPKGSRRIGELNYEEVNIAERKIILIIQEESFNSDHDKRLSSLKTYKDEQGLLRLKTKIVYRKDVDDFRNPIILPSNHQVVERLILTEHRKNSHAGSQMLLNILREHYWILNARRRVRSLLSRCVVCIRHGKGNMSAPTAPLPENRTKDAAIFEIIGFDLAGPLYLKEGTKAWICLFTCAVYRAVHLELLSSLSTEVFLQGFRRFIARRGRPSFVYCDNGTNFVGASNQLKSVDWNKIVNYSTARKIEWLFNPPAAPWWGGFWERLVGVTKQILRRVLGKACLSYEEMTTILCDTEAIINLRPLTYISECNGEIAPLSPSLFLQEIRQQDVPDFDHTDENMLNRRIKYRQQLIADLRKRFRSEYLGLLIQRAESSKESRQVFLGDVVLIGTDNVKRIDWPLGRIIEILPGKDSVTRLVRLQTATTQLLRPIQRIFPLEVSSTWTKGHKKQLTREKVQPDPATPGEESIGATLQKTRSGRAIKVPQKLDL